MIGLDTNDRGFIYNIGYDVLMPSTTTEQAEPAVDLRRFVTPNAGFAPCDKCRKYDQ